MPTWSAPVAWAVGTAAMLALRAPFIRRSIAVPVVESRIGARERVLVTLVGVGLLLLPLVWTLTPWLGGVDYAAPGWALPAGLAFYAAGLWLLRRTHVDLGRNWSNTLQLREGHRLVTDGVYARVRHPMYTALLLHAAGQALVLPNVVAGPAYLVAFALLVTLRLRPEEALLRDRFGAAFDAYRARTARLVPGVW